jgi:hypothetical protein
MPNILWADVSEFQVPVDDRYPHSFFCLRSNDGLHRDTHFSQNLAWANKAVASGKLFGYLVYYFYRPRVDAAAVLRQMVGTPNPRMGVMIDVEGDGGKVSGNQSTAINAQFEELAAWLGDRRRVVGYGNVSDLNSLWPQKPIGLRIVIAAYGTNPDYPGKFAHQYSSTTPCAPFGPCDANSADNMSQADMEQMFGWASAPTPPTPTPTPIEGSQDAMFVRNNSQANVPGPDGKGGLAPGDIALCSPAGAVKLGNDWKTIEDTYKSAGVPLVLIQSSSLLARFTAIALH